MKWLVSFPNSHIHTFFCHVKCPLDAVFPDAFMHLNESVPKSHYEKDRPHKTILVGIALSRISFISA